MSAIKIDKITKRFGTKTAVNNLSLEINEGELFALLGVNGAGKTTLIKTLTCLLKPNDGEAYILGKSVTTQADEVKKLINLSTQETAVAPNLTVRENLMMIAGIYGMDKESAKAKTDEMINKLSFGDYENQRAKTLSGGWQRKLSIAMALITEPKVLFLDEPTLGLDVLARRELWELVRKLKGKMTIILTTHYMEEAESLSDRIGVMINSNLITVGTPDELMKKTETHSVEEAFVKIAGGGLNEN
ncbi:MULTISPECIES: ABC transporter ATP-binding protein [unclassified Ruminococcus]|uniref:ABC transporter ATP-binding protein n=1 Tax=unclassified Ruminococcus TaxID=2608920 RepID=UPI00210CC697|nr:MULTISPECIES: ABC transporter ATP-binding protein [unclassified Ruminococcus]MCQ4022746.1 ATP-binding cassette domain-containing protein [Ruminococcus sp. zg-924]MCQ4114986.1 ATP-binding cassette domain-containing protein [Ruminococcus sp. zg-921]